MKALMKAEKGDIKSYSIAVNNVAIKYYSELLKKLSSEITDLGRSNLDSF
jgi:hypothetical protein